MVARNRVLTLATDKLGKSSVSYCLLQELGVRGEFLQPGQSGFSDEPTGHHGESQVVLPSEILKSLEFIPTELRFGLLIAAFDKIALAFTVSHSG